MHLGGNRGCVPSSVSKVAVVEIFSPPQSFPLGIAIKLAIIENIEGLYGEERERFDCSYNSLRGRL